MRILSQKLGFHFCATFSGVLPRSNIAPCMRTTTLRKKGNCLGPFCLLVECGKYKDEISIHPNYVEIYRYKSFSFTSFDILLIFNLQRGRCRMLSFFWACARCKYAMWARQHTWLLLSFSPIPVRHPLHPLCR